MHTGLVIWFNDSKGFGLIETEAGQTVFVHYSGIVNGSSLRNPTSSTSNYHSGAGATAAGNPSFKTLTAGQKVEFDLYEDAAKGYFARNVVSC